MRVLLLEDSDLDAALIAEQLREAAPDLRLRRVATRSDYKTALADDHDLILSDYALPGFDGLQALDLALGFAPETPFIFVSGVVGEEFAIEALKRGATDYVLKQRLARLPMVVARAVREARERQERLRAQAQLQLLLAELNHRANNLLAVVQALFRTSLRSATNLKAFENSFLARLQSLAKTQRLLSDSDWAGVSMRDLLQAELGPYAGPRGPVLTLVGRRDLHLPAGPAMHLALVFHELATNAAKYGAFSTAGGQLWVSWGWHSVETGRLWIEWRERRQGPAPGPTGAGFGSRLIERTVSALGGSIEAAHAPEGISNRIEATVTAPGAQVWTGGRDLTGTVDREGSKLSS